MRRSRKRAGGNSGSERDYMDVDLTGHFLGWPFNLMGQLTQPWYATYSSVIAVIAAILAALIGGKITLHIYNKNKNAQIIQTYLQFTSKNGILIDLYIILVNHYIYAEELRLLLELYKRRLRFRGKDEIEVEKCINELSSFSLYRDAKARTEDVKLEVARSNEQFWANVNQNRASFLGLEEQPFLSAGEAMRKLYDYKFESYKI
jgi:hypothetical protein